MIAKPISRRELLKDTGALVVSFSILGQASRALAQQLPAPPGSSPYNNPDYLDPTSLDSWLAVMQDGSVTAFTGKVDLGTGVETALAQIVADERVHMMMGDTAKTVDQGRTAGSQTITRAGTQIRQAIAAARQELLKMASAKLDSPVEKLTVSDGVISVAANPTNKTSYGELIGGRRFNVRITATGMQQAMEVAPEVRPKSYKDYRIVGTSVRRVDVPAKLTGEFTYTPDIRIPGMLHGRVVRPATVISKPASIDESSIKDIPGIVKVVREGSFVGVVAETEWSAIRAARELKVSWSEPAVKLPANPEEVDQYLRTTKSFKDQVATQHGNVGDAFAHASKTLEATYRWPFQLHGMLGPSCAVADFRGDKVTVWTGAQGPFTTRDRVASMLGFPKRNVDVIFVESSGCYGRLTSDDAAEDAALMSRAVGKPVRVQWMRADEHGWEPKGPQQLISMRAALDAQGKVIGWEYISRTFPWTEAQGTPQLGERQIGQKNTAPLPGNPVGSGAGSQTYDFENQNVLGMYIPWPQDDPTPLRTNPLRSPGEPGGIFAGECFIDEIASELRVDPVQFRLRYLTSEGNKRAAEALKAAAQKAGWQERPSPAPASDVKTATGQGIAVATRQGTIVAVVAEVDVDKSTGQVRVKRVVVAHDCGLIVNPDGLRFQIDGNVIQGVSRTLMEEVQFDASGQKNLDWQSYPVITFSKIPEIEPVLINRPELPYTGAGEPGIVPVPAAIANAVFDAIGARMRIVPLTPERVLNAMRSKAGSAKA
jgi:nicotinate dehydrogenase subunit B